jgi:hypothetical protein
MNVSFLHNVHAEFLLGVVPWGDDALLPDAV